MLNNMASAMLTTSESAQALPLFERVLRIRERAFGPSALLDVGDARSARPLLERAERISQAQQEDDPELHGSLASAMGRLLLAEGKAEHREASR